MLELVDRPTAYDDVGRLCRWGMVTHELKNYEREMSLLQPTRSTWQGLTIDEFVRQRGEARDQHLNEMPNVASREPRTRKLLVPQNPAAQEVAPLTAGDQDPHAGGAARRANPHLRRRGNTPGKIVPPRASHYVDRRTFPLLPARGRPGRDRRRGCERRESRYTIPFPDRRLTRSAYEKVFLKLVSGGRLRVGNDLYRPVGMKGWYRATFRRESDGKERLLTIDQLLWKMDDWV
jgi:hypothetical protein